ncbi:MAG: hypothetical protein QQN46_08375 [Nitrosopumilus sp.]
MRPVDEFDNPTDYEKLSQKVGFYSQTSVSIPTVSIAENLLKLVKFANSIEAAEAVMKVVRFSRSPKTNEEREAKKICCEASQLARQSFGGGEL